MQSVSQMLKAGANFLKTSADSLYKVVQIQMDHRVLQCPAVLAYFGKFSRYNFTGKIS